MAITTQNDIRDVIRMPYCIVMNTHNDICMVIPFVQAQSWNNLVRKLKST